MSVPAVAPVGGAGSVGPVGVGSVGVVTGCRGGSGGGGFEVVKHAVLATVTTNDVANILRGLRAAMRRTLPQKMWPKLMYKPVSSADVP